MLWRVGLGSAGLDNENIPALRILLRPSLGLVTVEASSSTVRQARLTLQEHLPNQEQLSIPGKIINDIRASESARPSLYQCCVP